MKTVVNSAAAGWAAPVKWEPSEELTRAIYGLEPVPTRVGLYSVDGIDPGHRPAGSVTFTALSMVTPKGKIMCGAYIGVHGMPFLAALHTDLADALEAGTVSTLTHHFSEAGQHHTYHPGSIVITRQRGKPVFVGLSWGGLLRYADGSTKPIAQDRSARAD